MAECSVPKCEKAATRRKFCDVHYRRFMRHGDPEKVLITAERGAILRAAHERLAHTAPERRAQAYAKRRQTHHSKRVERTCPMCGQGFGGANQAYVKPSQRTCSALCGHRLRKHERALADPDKRKLRFYAEKTCEQCGTTIAVIKRSKLHTTRFCSVSCRAAFQAAQPYDEWRALIGEANRGRLVGDKNPMWNTSPPHGKWTHYAAKDGNTYKFRSRWERDVAQYLDARNEPWEYERERFILGEVTYLPDFYLPARGVYWEVKGWMSEKALARIDAFRAARPEPLVVIGPNVIKGFQQTFRRAA